MSRKEIDQVSGTQTTGHEWDGIKELDTPMPRWRLGLFWATIVWAIGYWVVYPAWPGLTGSEPPASRRNIRPRPAMSQSGSTSSYLRSIRSTRLMFGGFFPFRMLEMTASLVPSSRLKL